MMNGKPKVAYYSSSPVKRIIRMRLCAVDGAEHTSIASYAELGSNLSDILAYTEIIFLRKPNR